MNTGQSIQKRDCPVKDGTLGKYDVIVEGNRDTYNAMLLHSVVLWLRASCSIALYGLGQCF